MMVEFFKVSNSVFETLKRYARTEERLPQCDSGDPKEEFDDFSKKIFPSLEDRTKVPRQLLKEVRLTKIKGN